MTRCIPIVLVACAAAGCASDNIPLVFGQTHTIGFTVSGSAPEQGGEFTFAYRDRNIAVIPVEPLSTAQGDFVDALSVVGQFEVDAKAKDGGGIALGKFFATGLAARTLADGFKCQVSQEAPHKDCTPRTQ